VEGPADGLKVIVGPGDVVGPFEIDGTREGTLDKPPAPLGRGVVGRGVVGVLVQLPMPTPFPTKPIVEVETRPMLEYQWVNSTRFKLTVARLPELHVQVNPPAVFLQVALGSQGLLAHSSLSEHVKPSPV
jgi:hypothetical protein